MAKFSDVVNGSYARRQIELELNGTKVPLDVRVLRPDEEADVLASAIAYAKEHGSTSPEEGDPLYEIGVWLYTAVAACVERDSPADAPVPFFDGGADQIKRSDILTRNHLAYLWEHQAVWQAECSPYEREVSDAELMARIAAIAEGDMRPFVALRPSTRWLFVRGLAARHVALLALKLPLGLRSPETPEVDKAQAPS